MPAADDNEGYMSSSSGEISEPSSGDSMETERAPSVEHTQDPASLQQEVAGRPDSPRSIHDLPRVNSSTNSTPRKPMLILAKDDPHSNLLLSPPRQQIPRAAAIRQASLPSRGRAQIRRHGRINALRLPQDRRQVHSSTTPSSNLIALSLSLSPGLTKDHPTLTTYFDGEIIGSKYTFQTRHPSWGATDKTDMQHWARFPAWRPLAKQAKKPDFHYKNFAQRENIFMRWKESFLVPDHRVREISGASFEGFYYICFNQCNGDISGIYFHAKSEKYQQLELKKVEDRGCLPVIEFR
ncbi:MAG: hypothetical protein Q9222_005159 [Ikaeria aurantiellina]